MGRHGDLPRGLTSTKSSPLFEGRFGRMFRTLPAATYGSANPADDINVTNLEILADAMVSEFDPPKDGFDAEESGIPALYTYFGQFIDHDITFDPASSLQQQNDPDALVDYRTPALDLDNVYGRGPDDQPYLYDSPKTFLLGAPLAGGTAAAFDLPRNSPPSSPPAAKRALIGDPRNDENTIVSQLQGLFLRFHNRIVADHPDLTFPEAQRLVRFHYQYVVLNDFLPRIIHADVLNGLKTNDKYDQVKLKFYHPKRERFMPVEFSVAAYRLGHSMVRPGYRLNDDDSTLAPIFPVPGHPELNPALTGFDAVASNRAIDWGRFIDIDTRKYDGTAAENKKRLQFAYRIDTALVDPLKSLPPPIVASERASLAARNLIRSLRLGLPSGQSVARALGVPVIPDAQITIGQGVDDPERGKEPRPITEINGVFAGNCPLWTYVLAEAMNSQVRVRIPVTEHKTITTPQLGPVGGRIVAETFLGLLFGDPNSLLTLDPGWKPQIAPNFALKDLVAYALGL